MRSSDLFGIAIFSKPLRHLALIRRPSRHPHQHGLFCAGCSDVSISGRSPIALRPDPTLHGPKPRARLAEASIQDRP